MMLYTLEILLLSLLMICGLCAYGLALPFFLEKKKKKLTIKFSTIHTTFDVHLTYGYVWLL